MASASSKAPAWLQEKVYAPRRQRTVDLTRTSIDVLRQEGQRVSLASVAAKSKEIDPDGIGASESAILGNREARASYEQHRPWKGPARPRPRAVTHTCDPAALRVKADRDSTRARRRYLKLSKRDLVERLLAVEQAYAEQEERWLQVNDELLTVRLRAAQSEPQPSSWS